MYISRLSISEKRADNFLKKLRKEDDCRIWTGCVTAQGYGRVHFKELGMMDVRRFRWLMIHGLEGDERISTTCGNKLCCNPEHLYNLNRQF